MNNFMIPLFISTTQCPFPLVSSLMIVVWPVLLLKVMINRCRADEGCNNYNNPTVNPEAEMKSVPKDVQSCTSCETELWSIQAAGKAHAAKQQTYGTNVRKTKKLQMCFSLRFVVDEEVERIHLINSLCMQLLRRQLSVIDFFFG